MVCKQRQLRLWPRQCLLCQRHHVLLQSHLLVACLLGNKRPYHRLQCHLRRVNLYLNQSAHQCASSNCPLNHQWFINRCREPLARLESSTKDTTMPLVYAKEFIIVLLVQFFFPFMSKSFVVPAWCDIPEEMFDSRRQYERCVRNQYRSRAGRNKKANNNTGWDEDWDYGWHNDDQWNDW